MGNRMKTCIIAQFPPPIHGLSKAVDTMFNSSLKEEFDFSKIDLTDNKRFLGNMIKLIRNKSELFYLTLSQSRMGNLRDLIVLKVIRMKKSKCIVHLHGGYYRKMVDNDLPKWQRNQNYKAISQVNKAIVLSDSLRYIFKDMLPDERIFVVPNCVDDEYLSCEEKNHKHPDGKIHILYLSNFIESKGYKDVLKMALLEKNENRGYHFDFAGRFPNEVERKFFESYVRENELQDIVTYYGVVEGQRKKELLANNDIFVLLTRYPKEGQPISILEAMGNSLAIIATDFAAISDLVIDGESGMLVPTDFSVEQVYDRIRTLDIEKIGSINHSEVVNNYTEKNYIEKLRSVFWF